MRATASSGPLEPVAYRIASRAKGQRPAVPTHRVQLVLVGGGELFERAGLGSKPFELLATRATLGCLRKRPETGRESERLLTERLTKTAISVMISSLLPAWQCQTQLQKLCQLPPGSLALRMLALAAEAPRAQRPHATRSVPKPPLRGRPRGLLQHLRIRSDRIGRRSLFLQQLGPAEEIDAASFTCA